MACATNKNVFISFSPYCKKNIYVYCSKVYVSLKLKYETKVVWMQKIKAKLDY